MKTRKNRPLAMLISVAVMLTMIPMIAATASAADFTTAPMVANGNYYSLALKNDGTVWAWGDNSFRQLGDGTNDWRNTPVQVVGGDTGDQYLTGVTAIAAGSIHSLALKNDGSVWAWGDNSSGQLGDDGTVTKRNTPVQVVGGDTGDQYLTGVTAIAAGNNYSLALKNDGKVWAWGSNGSGSTPVQVEGLPGVTAIAAGSYHSLALDKDGKVWAWGWNWYGQLGDGTNSDSPTPVQVKDLTGVTAIAAGYFDSLALKNDGSVFAWGNNEFGQLGDGTYTYNYHPIPVKVVGGDTGDQYLSGVTAIAVGYFHSLALKEDGSVLFWGWIGGPLGDDSGYNPHSTPVKMVGENGEGYLNLLSVVDKGKTDAEFLQEKAAEILQNGLSQNNLFLNGKVLTLVIDDRSFVLSANANNRNINGEIALGDGYFLVFDIKGNGSNVKTFRIIQR